MTNQTAWVTGVDRGLGLGLARALLQRGWRVFAGRYAVPTAELEQLQAEYKDSMRLIPLDIGDDASVKAAAAEVQAQTDRIDLVINNAGILGDIEATLHDELNFQEMQQVYNVNTLGPLRVAQAFIGLLLGSDRPVLANISSEAGSIGQCYRQNWYGYCMSKTALNMQSALIYNQFKDQGLRLLLLHPGWVQSYMHGELNTKAKLTPDQAAANILGIIERCDQFKRADGRPAYIDSETGEPLPW